MADQDDFTFEEEETDSEEWYEEEESGKKGGSRTRLLLLLLLLVVAGGAAFFFLMMPGGDDGPAAPPQQVVKLKKKPIAMPSKSASSKPAPLPVKKAEVPENKDSAVAKQEDKQAPVETEKTVPAAEPAPVVKEEKIAEEPVKVAEKRPTEPAAKPEEEEPLFEAAPAVKQPVVASSNAPYSLTAGTYLLSSSVTSVSKKIRAIGYEPQIVKVKREVTMTRLKVGTYPRSEAAARVAELKPVAPGAFSIRKGNMATVYAGSFLVLDKARFFADRLYKQGVRLEEEPVKVEKELQRVVYGGFATAAEAKDVARQSAAKGIESQVLKNR